MCEGQLPAPGFSNTWIKRAEVVLPPLAIAIDDVTMAFAEQLQSLLGTNSSASKDSTEFRENLMPSLQQKAG